MSFHRCDKKTSRQYVACEEEEARLLLLLFLFFWGERGKRMKNVTVYECSHTFHHYQEIESVLYTRYTTI